MCQRPRNSQESVQNCVCVPMCLFFPGRGSIVSSAFKELSAAENNNSNNKESLLDIPESDPDRLLVELCGLET